MAVIGNQAPRGGALAAPARADGFSLVELLLALGLGLSFCALMLQAVMADGHASQRLARVARERLVAERALDLIRSDLQRSSAVASSAGVNQAAAACNLAGRRVVLHIDTPEGAVTYSVGKPSEPIWRGQVLMRCGSAFALDGTPSRGQALNRVLLDGLASSQGVTAEQAGPGVLRLLLRQALASGANRITLLQHQRLLRLP